MPAVGTVTKFGANRKHSKLTWLKIQQNKTTWKKLDKSLRQTARFGSHGSCVKSSLFHDNTSYCYLWFLSLTWTSCSVKDLRCRYNSLSLPSRVLYCRADNVHTTPFYLSVYSYLFINFTKFPLSFSKQKAIDLESPQSHEQKSQIDSFK